MQRKKTIRKLPVLTREHAHGIRALMSAAKRLDHLTAKIAELEKDNSFFKTRDAVLEQENMHLHEKVYRLENPNVPLPGQDPLL